MEQPLGGAIPGDPASSRRGPGGAFVARLLRSLGVMGLGLGALGVGSYLLLVTIARRGGVIDVAALGVFWSITFGLLAGLFLPCEQLLARSVADHDAGRTRQPPRHILMLYLGVALVGSAGVLLARDWLADEWLNGQVAVAHAIAALFPLIALQSAQRGFLAGGRRFDAYARQLTADGLSRAAWCLVLTVSEGPTAGLAAWGVVVAATISILVTPWGPMTAARTTGGWSQLVRDAISLSAGSTIATVVLNAGPAVVVSAGAGSNEAAAFAAVFVITRIPLFLLATSQAALIPWLGAAWHQGDRSALQSRMGWGLALLGGLGVVTVLALGLLVDVWASLLYGAGFGIGALLGVGLATSTGVFLTAGVFQAALVVAGRTRAVAAAWAVAAAVFVSVSIGGPGRSTERVVLAYLCCAASLFVLEWLFVRRVRPRPLAES